MQSVISARRRLLGMLAAVVVAAGTLLVPSDADYLYHALVVFLAFGMMSVTALAYAVLQRFYTDITLIAGLPVLLRYAWLWYERGDSFFGMLTVLVVCMSIIVLYRGAANTRWTTQAIEGYLQLHDEIVERRRVEAALAAAEAHSSRLAAMLRLMCDNVPDMIWAKDPEGRFLFVNQAMASSLLGACDTSEPLGRRMPSLLSASAPRIRCAVVHPRPAMPVERCPDPGARGGQSFRGSRLGARRV
jgi:PAS domain-containing protein